jgi:hypothetical protein
MPKSLEERIDRLESIEEIRGLMADYTHFFDSGWSGAGRDADRVAALFTDDATWDGGTTGLQAGRDKIREWCGTKAHSDNPDKMAVHIAMNPKIIVQGDRARGSWTGLIPLVTANAEAMWVGGRYECELVRQDGRWRFSEMKFFTAFQTPYEDGFAKTRMFVSKAYA